MRLPLFITLMLAAPAQADLVEVDLELALMVDTSRSMNERELEIQRRGYAEALRSPQVLRAVQSGLLQRVAMSYIEWSGSQRVVVDWTLVETAEDLDRFASKLDWWFDPALRRTSISEALLFGAQQIESNDFDGLRRVIDISGDGPNNQGRGVETARNTVVAQGIIINGLPLMTDEGAGSAWHLDGLDVYYRTCVVGGPGAFVIPVLDWDDFADAVRRKLVLEMVGLTPELAPIPAQARARDPSDCRIGEKIWEERRQYWGEP